VKNLIRNALRRRGYQITRASTYRTGVMQDFADLPIRSVLDIGAADGDTAAEFLRAFPEAHVYAFEPLPKPFALLRAMADRQPGRLSAFNVALGSEEGELEMREHVEHSTSSSVLQTTELSSKLYPDTAPQGVSRIKMTTLDRWYAAQSPAPAGDLFVKMDCQGYEDRVIRGGMETLRRARVCVMEVFFKPLYQGQATFKELYTLMDGMGFRYHGSLDQGVSAAGLVQADIVFAKP
jgi:FkbM family methyltransferase